MSETELDFDERYRVKGYNGVAWYLISYKKDRVPTRCLATDADGNEYWEDDWSETEEVEDRSLVIAVMVGDDRKFTFDIEDLEILKEDDYCHECGQIGCTSDGRDRSET